MTDNRKVTFPSTTVLAIPAIAALAVLGLTGCNESEEEGRAEQQVTVEHVPAAVRATLEQERQGGTLTELEKITAEGKTVYAADMVVNGKNQETVITEDGKVMKREVKVRSEQDDD